DTFDYKPTLAQWHGKSYNGNIETLFPFPGPIMESPYKFEQHGQCGAHVSEIFPNLAKHVDDMTIIKSCTSTELNHVPACYMFNTGISRVGSPSVGSYASYGLGSENENLPAFIVMYDGRSAPEGGANLWDSGFLPPEHQGVPFRSEGDPVLYLNGSSSRKVQREKLDLLHRMNQQHQLRAGKEHQVLETRIRSFETAFKMQTSLPNLVDLSSESEATQEMYGIDIPESRDFGTQLLMARRLVESGVRFQQIYHGGWVTNWDSHGGLEGKHRELATETDKPIAGLLSDLKQRGLLDSTLVIWGGEFGRLPISQDKDGRDHNPYGFTVWMAGGGVKQGFTYGATDEFGYKAIENPVSMHDLHATILHLMGIDEELLTYRFNGREQTMTNGLGSVVNQICA
ncbi:MAG: DUF1501 domain-containing protein, partial [Planctomycetota bacterium]